MIERNVWQSIYVILVFGCFYYFLQNSGQFSYCCVVQQILKYFLAQYCQERHIILQDHKEIVLQKCFIQFSGTGSKFLILSNMSKFVGHSWKLRQEVAVQRYEALQRKFGK